MIIDELIANQHPVIVQIRWMFHSYMLRTYKEEKQWGFDRWSLHIKEDRPVTVWKVIKRYIGNKEFRHDVNSFLKDQLSQQSPNRYESLKQVYPETLCILDIEVFEKYGKGEWAQSMFLCHLHDDVYWTNDPNRAADMIGQSLSQLKFQIENKEL